VEVRSRLIVFSNIPGAMLLKRCVQLRYNQHDEIETCIDSRQPHQHMLLLEFFTGSRQRQWEISPMEGFLYKIRTPSSSSSSPAFHYHSLDNFKRYRTHISWNCVKNM